MLGKIEGRRRRGWQRTGGLGGLTDSLDMSLSKLREVVKDREVWRAAVHGVAKSRLTGWLNNNNPSGCEMISYCGFDLHFSYDYLCWACFHMLVDYLYLFSGEKKKKVKLLSHVQLFVTPWTVAHQTLPSMESSRQEYWSGLPLNIYSILCPFFNKVLLLTYLIDVRY